MRRALLAAAAAAAVLAPSAVAADGGIRGLVEIRTNVHFQGSIWWGTGVVLMSSGEVLTNNHVIRGASSIEVTDVASGRTYRATVAGYDVAADIAVLKLQDAARLQTAPLGHSAVVVAGDLVTAYGAPNGPHTAPVAVHGKVGSRRQTVIEYDPYTGAALPLRGLISSNAPTRPGFSGGPLVDANGGVIGINTVGTAASGSKLPAMSGAIPIDRARSIVATIEAGRSTREIHTGPTPLLGLTIQPGGLYSGLTSGVTVLTVLAGSPARRAGLKPGDIVQSFDGRPVASAGDLTSLLTEARTGETVELGWQTPAGTTQTARVLLVAGPPQ